MSRSLKTLAMAVGGLGIFAVFALAGWALTDLLADQDEVTDLETVALTEYPLQPADDDIVEQLAQLGAEQDLTAEGLSGTGGEGTDDTIDGQGKLGSAAAGGQTIRVVERSTIEFEESSTTDDPSPDSEEPIPADLLDDLPRLLGGLDLSEIQVADPVGPILIDVCAGPERLPEIPEGCSFGFGGTILEAELDDDPTYGVAIFLATESHGCETSDDAEMSLIVASATPGTINLTLWQGAPRSDPPPGAFFSQYTTPAELADMLTAALDAGESELSHYCIEVPVMTGELVAEHSLVSSYPAHGSAIGPIYRDTLTARSGRPPTIMQDRGPDDIWIVNRRATNEEAWVKAVEVDLATPAGEVCNTGGREIGPRGPTPNGLLEADVVASLESSTPVNLESPGSYPYELFYNVDDIHHLNLESAKTYAVCNYVVSITPFNEVVFSEAAIVSTPTTRGIEIKLVGAGGTGESSVELTAFELATPCGTSAVEYPGLGVHVQYDRDICRADFNVFEAIVDHGFAVTVHTSQRAESERVETGAWIPVESSDVLCSTTCAGDVETVVRIPVDGFDFTESGRQHATVGYIDLSVTFTAPDNPGGSPTWDLGSLDAYNNADPGLPENPRVFARLESTPLSFDTNRTPSAEMRIAVYADRLVDYTATVDPTFPTCEGTGAAITEGSGQALRGSGSSFELSGLCIGVQYPVTVEAVDADGTRTTGTFEFFTETSQTLTLRAELQLEPLPPFGTDTVDWHQTFRHLDASHRPTWPVLGAAGGNFTDTQVQLMAPADIETLNPFQLWDSNQDRGFFGTNICDGSSTPPGPQSWLIRDVPVRSLDWSVSTMVIRAEYNRNFDGPDCQPGRANPSAPLNIEIVESVRVAASGLTLEELLQGVVITTETAYGTPSMRVWAELN